MKTKKIKIEKKIDLENLKIPEYAEICSTIEKRLGGIPKMPQDLSRGEWTEQAVRVLEERYLQKDDEGKIVETPEEMCWRVAWDIASAEAVWGRNKKQVLETAREFYRLLVTHEFLPNSPTLMNAGTGNKLQYSACFVIPVEDSMEGIFDALKYQALIHKTGGGTGFSFSRLRPSGAPVKTSSGVASGPISFMRIFDAATNEVKQGGKRRGANMGILRVDHPDVMQFIHCKEEGGITNFNISVGITDAFMKAYQKGENYDLLNPKTGEKAGSLSAKEVFEEVAKLAWKTGDPGIVFLDRINKGPSNPVPGLGPIESTNPCGEQPLYPFDSCNLGSIFLNFFVKKNANGGNEFDWEKLDQTTRLAVRFLDNVIEINPYTLPQIRQTTLGIRRIGLGVGGWADLLVSLKIPYDSQEALNLAEKIMSLIKKVGIEESQELAKLRGPFPLWSESVYKGGKPRRNSTVTTIAPTGTISIIAGASSGIEPLFALAYMHVVKDQHLDRRMSFVNPEFIRLATEAGIWSSELEAKVAEKGVIGEIDEIPEEIRRIFVTAHEISPEWHIKTQTAFQKNTENAVSKTINLNHNATIEDVKKAYLQAWEEDCKGITIFRDGCKDAQVLNLGLKDQVAQKEAENVLSQEPVAERPFRMQGATYRLVTPQGSAFVTINEDDDGQPMEIFINIGKAGSDLAAMAEALGRTISISLRFRGPMNATEKAHEIALQLSGIGGRRSVGFGTNKIRSLPDAVAAAISVHYGFKINGFNKDIQTSEVSSKTSEISSAGGVTNGISNGVKQGALFSGATPISQEVLKKTLLLENSNRPGDLCPSCGESSFVFQEGCSKCYSCGHSEC